MLLRKIRPFPFFVACSLLVHLFSGYLAGIFGNYHLGRPVAPLAAVVVDLKEATAAVASPGKPDREKALPDRSLAGTFEQPTRVEDEAPPQDPSPAPEIAARPPLTPKAPAASPVSASHEPPAVARDEPLPPVAAAAQVSSASVHAPFPAPKDTVAEVPPSALQALSRSLSSRYEKLSYLLTMGGIPIGSAELESKNEKGVTSITLRMRSNAAVSSIYPVDDLVETQHVDGRFIMTKIRQQEGSFKSDESFTINLGKRRVSWVDLLHNRSLKMTVPSDEVMDTLSGIYYLRFRPLQVGKTETLHIYDSETYAEVPVEVLRHEEMRLLNLTKVDTLVVRPLQKTAGIFRRTGDVFIWMTDDDRRVPVKIVTTIALGKVTAQLVSAESKPHEETQTSGSERDQKPASSP